MGQAYGGAHQIEGLVDRIYDAAVNPALWSETIAGIVDAAGCRSGVFYEHDTATRQSRPLGFYRFNTDFIRDYESHYAALDPWNRRVAGWPVGVAAPTYALIPDDEFRRTEFYQDYLRRTGVFYGLGGVVERSRGRMAVFGVQCAYDDGQFSPEATALIGTLMPHLGRAYRMHTALGRARRDRETLEDALHLMEKAVLIVEADGTLVFANRAAEQLLRDGDGIRVAKGVVVAANRSDQAALAALLHPPADGGTRPMIALRRPKILRPLLVDAVPLRPDANSGERLQDDGRVVLLVETGSAPAPAIDRLAAMFSLTTAEARLWSGLIAGHTLAEVAARHHVSINTVRVQLGRLFQKVGVHRQADLVRRALELRDRAGRDSNDPGPNDPG